LRTIARSSAAPTVRLDAQVKNSTTATALRATKTVFIHRADLKLYYRYLMHRAVEEDEQTAALLAHVEFRRLGCSYPW
jgi:hypothetical protein